MSAGRSDPTLKAYETYNPSNSSLVENVFGLTLLLVLGLFIGLGLFFHTIKALPEPLEKKIEEIKTRFVIEEAKKPKPKPVEKKKPEPEKPAEKPIDLTQKPLLAQKIDDIPKEPPPENMPPARRVFGLRRVYSVGIGAGGEQSEAVIGKIGNTLNKDVDTITATKQDLKGALAPITAVTVAPSPKNTVKPEYTKEMIDAKIEGVIRAELLIDIDGTVKDVRILNDLGYGTKEAARRAFIQWTFEPAKKGATPVAVWISFSIRFVLVQ
jgi:outer membrane biosynthesis protein TonB